MTDLTRVWIEGERIPEDRVAEIFRRPPGAPPEFARSALVIGARGVGKTTLFRFLKESHNGIAIHLSLATEFASLTKQTSLGPLATYIPEELEPLLVGKATSLLATAIAERLRRRGIDPPARLIQACIPSSIAESVSSIDAAALPMLRVLIAAAPLDAFEGFADVEPIVPLISELGKRAELQSKPLMLLLDRADMVVAPSLLPVFQLLDQSEQFLALVAMRPCNVGRAINNFSETVVAGDHYGVVHLGIHPRTSEWSTFVQDSIRAQIGGNLDDVPKELQQIIISLSRDSIRVALELVTRYLAARSDRGLFELISAIDDLRDNQLSSAQRTLQQYHKSFRDLVNTIRTNAAGKDQPVRGPVLVSVQELPAPSIFDTETILSRFIDAALRCGALCMPEGQRWAPGLRPTTLEMPPLLLWRKEHPTAQFNAGDTETVRITEREMLQTRGRRPRPPNVFIAYRMTFQESIQFRNELQRAIGRHPDLATAQVVDGRVPDGAPWANTIRERIKRAKVVVADVTGLRPDVLFELGFAYGLNRVTVPVVAESTTVAALPSWLGGTQLGRFGQPSGISRIVSSIATLLRDPEFANLGRPPQAIPDLAVWVHPVPWTAHAYEQFETITYREGLQSNILTDSDRPEQLIRRAVSAGLLVVPMDGGALDGLMHYIAGAVAARPQAGTGRTFERRVLVVTPEELSGSSPVADSLRRCEDTIRVIKPSEVRSEVQEFASTYRSWKSGGRSP